MFQSQIAKVTPNLVNLTKHSITVYDKTDGSIVTLPPSCIDLPEEGYYNDRKPSTMYVVDSKTAIYLKNRKGRTLSDIAIIRKKEHGRNNIEITYLSWGEDPHTEVSLCSHNNTF